MSTKQNRRNVLFSLVFIFIVIAIIFLIVYLGYLAAGQYRQSLTEVYQGAVDKFNDYLDKVRYAVTEGQFY